MQEAVRADIPVPGKPFGVIATLDDRWLLVSLTGEPERGIAVIRRDGAGGQVAHVVPLDDLPMGLALSQSGTVLLVAGFSGTVSFVDVARATSGAAGSLLGQVRTGAGMGTVKLVVTHDERYLFASEENQAAVTVLDLGQAQARRYGPEAVRGRVPVEHKPVGLALSPDGSQLYVTAQAMKPAAGSPADSSVSAGSEQFRNQEGSLSVIGVARAPHAPSHAVVSRVAAGKNPVRVVLSHGGQIAWVTARASNALLAFDTAALSKDPAGARRATAPVGIAPVGVTLVDGDRIALVANSDRFSGSTAAQTVSIVDTAAALDGRPATLGTLQVGAFPREFGLSPRGDRVFLTNFGSKTVTTIDVAALRNAAG
jgi:DNA-binding beta-propeller fold protein YncE